MYGVNYAWHHFAADFGGIAAWDQRGVAGNRAVHDRNFADMRAHGVSTVRWWMFPSFRGEAVSFDGSGRPTGIGETVAEDIRVALELADRNDVYLMLTLFSFDNFYASGTVDGLYVHGLTPIVRDGSKRSAMLEQVVRPVARAVAESPHADRMIAWDVINEPEWAMSGASPYGDEAYDPIDGIDALSHGEMEQFVADVIAVLRAETDALVTVGGAAMKWKRAWSRVDIDFYQFHMYEWVDEWWPYERSPAQYGITDKPIVMGEYFVQSLNGASFATVTESWFQNGYGGALGWQYNQLSAAQLDQIAAFAAAHPCETSY